MKQFWIFDFGFSILDFRLEDPSARKSSALHFALCSLRFACLLKRSKRPKFLGSGFSSSAGAINHTSKHLSKDFESVDTLKAKTLFWITAMRRAMWIAFLRLRLNWFS